MRDMLEIRGLHTHYGLSHIIQGVDLVARPGEVVGIFGRNGVGKTTLLKSVAGWVRPSAGDIRLDGDDLNGLSPDQIARRGVGFVPEDRRIFPGLTVEENLTLGLRGFSFGSSPPNRTSAVFGGISACPEGGNGCLRPD